jgi:neutral trehalase
MGFFFLIWHLQETPDVALQPERHSLLPLRNRVVVPGERFREVYYWDSYWVVKGLLVSGMFDTATVRTLVQFQA